MTSIDPASAHAAIEARDQRFDGVFFVGVASTKIYCRCICTARTPKRENRSFYASAAAAEKAGFRPCLLCRPERAPGQAPVDAARRLAAQALMRVEAGAFDEIGVAGLAAELAVSPRHLRRVVRDAYGASLIDLAQTSRLLTAKRLLRETNLNVTEIAFAAGFGSVRRLNTLTRSRYGKTPRDLRGPRSATASHGLSLTLSARGAYDSAPVFEFLVRRALPGMEIATSNSYARTLNIGATAGWLKITPQAQGIALQVSEGLVSVLRPLIASARGAFDLDVDCAAVDAHLHSLSGAGVRIAGGVDGFEIAVRAVLGQQVSLSAACQLAVRLVRAFGAPSKDGPEGLHLLFPSSARLAEAGAAAIAAIGLPMRRAETVQRLAQAHASGALNLARGAIGAGRAGLAEISGVGPWTIEYIALRALGDPDAFPASDAVIRAALRGRNADHWRPWRGYAAMRLWREAAQGKHNESRNA